MIYSNEYEKFCIMFDIMEMLHIFEQRQACISKNKFLQVNITKHCRKCMFHIRYKRICIKLSNNKIFKYVIIILASKTWKNTNNGIKLFIES